MNPQNSSLKNFGILMGLLVFGVMIVLAVFVLRPANLPDSSLPSNPATIQVVID